MENTNAKRLNKFFAGLMIVACFVMSICFINFSKGDIASAETPASTNITVKVQTVYTLDGESDLSDQTLLTNNMGTAFDAISTSVGGSLFDSATNVVANDRDADQLYFVGYFIISHDNQELNVSDSLNHRKIKTLTFDADFVEDYVVDGVLTIYARFEQRKQINISVDSASALNGSFDVVLRDKKDNIIAFTNGGYYPVGTKVSVLPSANKYYRFSKFVQGETSHYEQNFADVVAYNDINLELFFEKETYALSFNIVNTIDERLGNEKINLDIMSANKNTPVATMVEVGDKINRIYFDRIGNYHNYRFKQWELLKVDGTRQPIVARDVDSEISNIDITEEFIDNYVVDGKIEFYAVFVQNCQLSIVMEQSFISSNAFKVTCDGVQVTDFSTPFDYGTDLFITVDPVAYMNFIGFDGLIEEDEFTAGQSSAFIKMLGNRSIQVKYEYKSTGISLSGDSNAENGNLKLSANSVKIGDTLVINANLNGGYKIKNFEINQKSANKFVSELNQNSEGKVAVLGDNGILTIYVTKDVYDYFVENSILNISIETKIDGLYIGLFVFYFIFTLALGGIVIAFSILSTRKFQEIKRLKEKQYQAVLEKERKENYDPTDYIEIFDKSEDVKESADKQSAKNIDNKNQKPIKNAKKTDNELKKKTLNKQNKKSANSKTKQNSDTPLVADKDKMLQVKEGKSSESVVENSAEKSKTTTSKAVGAGSKSSITKKTAVKSSAKKSSGVKTQTKSSKETDKVNSEKSKSEKPLTASKKRESSKGKNVESKSVKEKSTAVKKTGETKNSQPKSQTKGGNK